MAALSASTQRLIRDNASIAALILEGAQTYQGSFAKLNGPTHGTSDHQGRVEVLDTDSGSIPFGLFNKAGTLGSNGANRLDGDESEDVRQDVYLGSFVLGKVAVTGASAQTDVGSKVYLSNDNDLTLTRPTKGLPVGMVMRYYSSTEFDVYIFSVETIVAIALAGAGQYTWHLGVVVAEASGAGNVLTGITAPHHGKILSVYAICASAPADADMAMDLNLEIGGTNVTGGVISLAAADTLGLKIAGTAITGANVFHEGDLIDVEAASVTAGTVGDGIYNLYAEVELMPGI